MSRWRTVYDEASREVLVGERFMFRRVCVRNGSWPGPSFRDYVQARTEALSRAVWRDRVECKMPDPLVLHACLALERYSRLTAHRGGIPTRAEWLMANSTLRVANLEVSAPVARLVGAGWFMTRVGSVWHMDEEYHVFVPAGAIREAATVLAGGACEVPIVTPMFLFRREGRGVVAAEDPEIRGIAALRVGNMISATVAGGRANG